MKKVFLFLVVFLFNTTAFADECNDQYFKMEKPIFLMDSQLKKLSMLCFPGAFEVAHSGLSKTPLYSAEHLTPARVNAISSRTNDFHSEERLPMNERAELEDYRNSGYDRGHLAPSADMENQKTQHFSFSLANIAPQSPTHNRKIWSSVEKKTRKIALRYKDVFVITGVLFIGDSVKRIGKSVLVPTHFYKIIAIPENKKIIIVLSENKDDALLTFKTLADFEKISNMRFPMFKEFTAVKLN